MTGTPRQAVRMLLAQKRILVDGLPATDGQMVIDQFAQVIFDGRILQQNTPVYLMLHKPAGVVSATSDEQHDTVLDLLRRSMNDSGLNDSGLNDSDLAGLHIAGRLDLHSSGLLLLTNDGNWSRALMAPDTKVAKTYEVTVAHPVSDECIHAFAAGMYFAFEDITTQPARLERLSPCTARVILTEGKYHQIKRMFGRFRNPVLALHRTHIGTIALDPALLPGQFRALTAAEVAQASGTVSAKEGMREISANQSSSSGESSRQSNSG